MRMPSQHLLIKVRSSRRRRGRKRPSERGQGGRSGTQVVKALARSKLLWTIENSGGEGSGQEQASLDDQEVIQTLMSGNVLPHIIDYTVRMMDIERFDESFVVYLELGHYLFAHSKAVDLIQVEASKALQEAQVENERARAKVDCLKVILGIQTIEVEHLREALQKEDEVFVGLRTGLTHSEDKRRKAKEEVSTERERAIEVFKSSKAMEDTKIAFALEAFLEEFEICMRVAKYFPEVDLDLLIDEPHEEAGPSNVGATSPAIESTLGAPKPAARALEFVHELEATKNTLTSPTFESIEV
ncbi:hypothetical protein COCNU_scaffold007393G000010 [Cocos nucifera]|nr:hypothetical protein [Cocos nucifera]